ncbi:hypothetical protein KA517_04900 [Candidatus Gracilibacteria bacterium]|nr:hypothetical protein [Candidatus Gracilibacteria bacterium]
MDRMRRPEHQRPKVIPHQGPSRLAMSAVLASMVGLYSGSADAINPRPRTPATPDGCVLPPDTRFVLRPAEPSQEWMEQQIRERAAREAHRENITATCREVAHSPTMRRIIAQASRPTAGRAALTPTERAEVRFRVEQMVLARVQELDRALVRDANFTTGSEHAIQARDWLTSVRAHRATNTDLAEDDESMLGDVNEFEEMLFGHFSGRIVMESEDATWRHTQLSRIQGAAVMIDLDAKSVPSRVYDSHHQPANRFGSGYSGMDGFQP